MKKMTLKNSFHNTEVTMLVPNGIETQREALDRLEQRAANGDPSFVRTLRRVQRALCGVEGCQCGTVRD
jgi:hypothetical protein